MNALKWYISKFPESLYPCSQGNQEEYNKRVILGRQKMHESTVVICGIAIGRLGNTDDVVHMIRCILSSSFTTGSTFYVNGGEYMS